MRNEGVYLTGVVFVMAEVSYPKQIQPNSALAGAVTQILITVTQTVQY